MKALPHGLDILFSIKENKKGLITENTCLLNIMREMKGNDLQSEMLHFNQRRGSKNERKILEFECRIVS